MGSEKRDTALLWRIFMTFFRISPVTFGGGYAMIPLLERVVCEKNKWIKKEDIVNVLAVTQTVPGSVAVNAATFIGFKLAGIPGAVAATIGVMLPTCFIIVVFAMLFLGFQHLPVVQAAFLGIRPAIVAMILFAALKVGRTSIMDKVTAAIGVLSALVLLVTPTQPIVVLLLGAVVGILFKGSRKSPQNPPRGDDEFFGGLGI